MSDVHVMAADGLGSPWHYYFACSECGWCSHLCDDHEDAARLGRLHMAVKAATKDERR